MDDNPYEPPQSPPEVRPSRKAVAGLSVLSLLVVPSAAIAGAATCLGTGTFSRPGAIPITLGFAMCLLCVVGALALQKASGSGIEPRELGRAVMLILIWQLVAIPVSLVVGFLGFAALILVSLQRRDESGMMALTLFFSFATYLVSSAIAYKTWQWYFQQDKPL